MAKAKRGGPKKVAVLLDHLANELGAIYTTYRLLEEGFQVEVLTPDGGPKLSGHSGMALDRFITVKGKIAEADPRDYAAVVCPGGFSADKLRAMPEVQNLLRTLDRDKRLIAHIGHGAWVPLSAGVLKGRKAVCPPQIKSDLENAGVLCVDAPVVADGHVLSGSEYGPFFKALVAALHARVKPEA
ncbi:MAG: DJ-1/PfpI family protein [Proteobacteria bacterium]|nr:DJ-1/PfpI family protein [Pseudomonadota bacterium]MBI3499781.1 DJ-1/PfpI family protein [Pseudomonadota bacterium]